jgi:predicted DNA-binding transcriptional regulator AlpA
MEEVEKVEDVEKETEYLTLPEALRILGISRQSLFSLRKSGRLTTFRKVNTILVRADDVRDLLTIKPITTKEVSDHE